MNVFNWMTIITAILLFSGCIDNQPAIKYQPNDSVSGQSMSWNFDNDSVGDSPQGANIFRGKWTIRKTDAPTPPNALCQIAIAEFPALSLGDTVYSDVVISTSFKTISGNIDQAAGIIFRIQDKDNYYILRTNALENNVNIYKYIGRRRSAIKEGSGKVVPGQWQELRVEAIGNHISGFLNGQLVVEATDDTYKAGKVGLWTKADSVTCFDDVMVNSLSDPNTENRR